MKIICKEHGSEEKIVDVKDIEIPDIWNEANGLPSSIKPAFLELWYIAHDMRGALQSIANGANLNRPIHTKR